MMKPYGSNHEAPNDRDYPDCADAAKLGLPTRVMNLRSETRRKARRTLKRLERRAVKASLRDYT